MDPGFVKLMARKDFLLEMPMRRLWMGRGMLMMKTLCLSRFSK